MTAEARRARVRPDTYLFFFVSFAAVVFFTHAPFFTLPFYWDELGQFVPAALDIFHAGRWVPESTVPNVHPPGVMAYLAAIWEVAGYSILATRLAMLLLASLCVFAVFLLAIQLCRGIKGAPAFSAVIFLLVSPLFYTQAMLAQLDMPAMLFTVLALLWFLQGRLTLAVAACTALVMVKETGLVIPMVFAAWLLYDRKPRQAAWFAIPVLPLALWLAVLAGATGQLFGNREFTEYNVFYPLHPIRLGMAFLRRAFFLFVDDFHWIGWIALALAWPGKIFASRPWRIAGSVFIAHVVAVTVLGGATLERYLLPALPIMYIAMAAAWSMTSSLAAKLAQAAMIGGLVFSLFWNPPWPFPYENNLAIVDFVRLHEAGAAFVEQNYPGRAITTAWPLTSELRRPEFGYVSRTLAVKQVTDFHYADASALGASAPDVFVLYSREWESPLDIRRIRLVRGLVRRMYGFEPQIEPAELERVLNMREVARWSQRGQWLIVFERRASVQ